MKLQDQCITYDQALRLKELGVTQNKSYAAWIKNTCRNETSFRLVPVLYPGCSNEGYEEGRRGCLQGYSAFTAAELMTTLKMYSFSTRNGFGCLQIGYAIDLASPFTSHTKLPLVQGLAAMLIRLLEAGVIKVEEVNQRLKQ